MDSKFRTRVFLAFAAIYVIWGSTYLAIRFTLESLPPFLTAGTRFILAGAIMYGIARAGRRAPPPTAVHWRTAFLIGACLLLGGNGGVVWAERTLSSGTAAVFIATVPLLMVLIEWLLFKGKRPSSGILAGIIVGFLGVLFLLLPAVLLSGNVRAHGIGELFLIVAALSWSFGSVFARRAEQHRDVFVSIGMQMLAGGLLLVFAGLLRGEWEMCRSLVFNMRSVAAFGYLLFFGSLLGFTSYVWLLTNVGAVQASTYAFVNPVIAVFLGWALAGEKVTPMTVVAAVMVITAVVIITFNQFRQLKENIS